MARPEVLKLDVKLTTLDNGGNGEPMDVHRLTDKWVQSGGDFTAGGFKLQGSVNGVNWVDLSGAAFTAPGQLKQIVETGIALMRAVTTTNLTGGTPTATLHVAGRNERAGE